MAHEDTTGGGHESPADDAPSARPAGYEPPAVEVLGTVEDLTRGPQAGSGDVPSGVIAF